MSVNSIHPNENAFPVQGWGGMGLTVRAEFAKAAMQGLLADPNVIDSQKVATAAVKLADALVAELNKPQKEVN